MNATIEDLKVHPATNLNNETKKALVRIIEDEFQNQTTQLQTNRVVAREKVLREYIKETGADKLMKKYRELEAKAEAVKKELAALGLKTNGSVDTYTDESRALNKRIEEATKEYSEPRTNKNKVISRMWMAKNHGEASVILQSVMGNGLIPSFSKKEILQIGHNGGEPTE